MKKNIFKTIGLILIIALLIILGVYAYNNLNNETSPESVNNYNNLSKEQKNEVENYLENNIADLSSQETTLGGSFYVVDINFLDDYGVVNYEDGHMAHQAKFDFSFDENGEVEINSFEAMDLDSYKDESDENKSGVINIEDQELVTKYIENNIGELSPEEPVLGGSFYVLELDFVEENIAIVDYEDGHIALTAKVNFEINNNNEVVINSFEIIPDGSTINRNNTDKTNKENKRLCKDMCGDGVCQEIVCLGEGCPCPESSETCPADCL